MRASTQVAPGVLPLASAIAAARPSLLPHGPAAAQAAALLAEAAVDLAYDRGWTARAAAALNPDQRIDPGPAPDLPHGRQQPWLDPELPALLDALGRSWGWAIATPPDDPPFDPWPGVEPRRRLSALRVLAPNLSAPQAHAIAGLALDAVAAQARRAKAEESLRALLDPAILASAARVPGEVAHVETAIEILRLRAR